MHDLAALARELNAPVALIDACEILTPAYTGARYPDTGMELDADDIADVIQAAQEVVAWCKTRSS